MEAPEAEGLSFKSTIDVWRPLVFYRLRYKTMFVTLAVDDFDYLRNSKG